ncbi:MAG TPA: metallopeptidase family protein [Phycisphaerae bacterium]|nr:metallopeptidase family protein [Phycisphaerae bacterium]
MRTTRKEFDRMVEAAIEALPEEFARWLEEVPVIVEDRPGKVDKEVVDEGGPPLGLYVGPSRLEADVEGVPRRIMIYREPLMEACRTREELEEEIRKTLVHELGHHAGMDEEELERRGYGAMEEDEMEWDEEE